MAWQDRDDGPRPIQPLYTRCPRRPVLGRDRDGSMARKPGNGHRVTSAGWRFDADARPHSARRPGSREGRRPVSAPVIRRRAAVRGPGLRHGRSMRSPPRAWRRIDRVAGCVAVRASRGRLGNTVAVGPCVNRQAVVVYFREGVTCKGAGRAETRSPATGNGTPRAMDGGTYRLSSQAVGSWTQPEYSVTGRRIGGVDTVRIAIYTC